MAFVRTRADGVPSAGVTRVGEVANTAAPEPVLSVSAAARFADDGVPSQVEIPVPSPLTPVDIGRPVAFVSVPEAGVPRFGAINVGPLSTTNVVPVPVCEAMAVAFPVEVIGPVRLAFAGVHAAPSVQMVPFTVVAALASMAFVMPPPGTRQVPVVVIVFPESPAPHVTLVTLPLPVPPLLGVVIFCCASAWITSANTSTKAAASLLTILAFERMAARRRNHAHRAGKDRARPPRHRGAGNQLGRGR